MHEHFFAEGHSGLDYFLVKIIDKTDVTKPTEKESYWIEKIKCYCPLGLNMREKGNHRLNLCKFQV